MGSLMSAALGIAVFAEEYDSALVTAGAPRLSPRPPNNCTSRTRKDSDAPAVPSLLVKVLTSGVPSTKTCLPFVR